jgi:hypothetical protein
MLNKIGTELEIFGSKVDPSTAKKIKIFYKVLILKAGNTGNWQVTRGFMVWFFLSWGIDYRTKK